MKKDDYPLAIAELLGVGPPVYGKGGPWMSSQGTVLADWLVALGEVLGVAYRGEKVRTMMALVESVGEAWDAEKMSSKGTESDGGGNITTVGFQALLRGVNRKLQTHQLPAPAVQKPFIPNPVLSRSEDFDAERATRIRMGQASFRAALLEAFEGRCAVSGCSVSAVLEAAHVLTYSEGGSYDLSNGLLLRSDIHLLFDRHLLLVDTSGLVRIHPDLEGSEYGAFDGQRISRPARASDRVPSASFAIRMAKGWLGSE
ncbi:HNH endonuclease [Aeromicrobium sp.]|uniref:HNH endonuclease n=1 Tax=Aeromicrobium sp. TaxID=1871063 RepID=UPI004034CF7A